MSKQGCSWLRLKRYGDYGTKTIINEQGLAPWPQDVMIKNSERDTYLGKGAIAPQTGIANTTNLPNLFADHKGEPRKHVLLVVPPVVLT